MRAVDPGEEETPVPRGLVHGLVTPFEPSGADLDPLTLERLVEFHVVRGQPAVLCPLLHLGESPSLSIAERRSVAERVVHAAAGQVPVWVHVSAPSTAAQIELAQHAEQIGAKAIVAAAPYHKGLADDPLASHFAELSDAVRISVILYNSPGSACGPALPPTMIGRLAAEHINIVGLKDASFDARYWIEVHDCVRSGSKPFVHMAGVDYVLPTVALGAASCVSVCSSIAPRLAQDLWQASTTADETTAKALQNKMTALLSALLYRYPASFKAALALMRRPVGPTRGPIVPLTSSELSALEHKLDALGILTTEPRGW
jgi:4-hydroxy-tetrahydrodipicolinate synthase